MGGGACGLIPIVSRLITTTHSVTSIKYAHRLHSLITSIDHTSSRHTTHGIMAHSIVPHGSWQGNPASVTGCCRRSGSSVRLHTYTLLLNRRPILVALYSSIEYTPQPTCNSGVSSGHCLNSESTRSRTEHQQSAVGNTNRQLADTSTTGRTVSTRNGRFSRFDSYQTPYPALPTADDIVFGVGILRFRQIRIFVMVVGLN